MPLARSPLAPAEPVTVVDGWLVRAVRAVNRELILTDGTPLATLCGVDLSDDLVPDGAALRTAVAALATDLIHDDLDGVRSYLLHCERSVGQYLFDALLRADAEFGLAVDGFHLPAPPAG